MSDSGRGRPVVLATRGSPLARWQAERVATLLRRVGAGTVEMLVVSTRGDRHPDAALSEIGGQGVFVKEVQAAVLDGRADAAVHSAKDLPGATPPGLVLAAVPERADVRDALVGSTLAGLRCGAAVGTSSPRRRAQLAWWRPDLTFREVRGNMDRRLALPGGVAAVVVAAAALARLGRLDRADQILSTAVLLPQVGQGALAVECRADDERMLAALGAVDDQTAHRAVTAERSFLVAVGGGCRAAIGAHARAQVAGGDGAPRWRGDGRAEVGVDAPAEPSPPLVASVTRELVMEAMLASADGHLVVQAMVRGDDPQALGPAALAALLARGAGAAVEGAGLGGAGLLAQPAVAAAPDAGGRR